MTAEQFSSADASNETHQHEASSLSLDGPDHHSHNEAPEASDYCSKCTHCIACISAITSAVSQDVSMNLFQALTSTFEFQYVSIVIPLHQKPPISV